MMEMMMALEPCPHPDFAAAVGIHRLTNEHGVVTGYAAEVRIKCSHCRRHFQFLGLPAGVDLQGATMSVDGLEARLAICPSGEKPSPLDRIAAVLGPPGPTH